MSNLSKYESDLLAKNVFSLLRSTAQAEEVLRCTHRGTGLSTATTRSGGSNRSWQTVVSILSSRANGSRWSLHTQMGEKLLMLNTKDTLQETHFSCF